jgi:hypothetical protein
MSVRKVKRTWFSKKQNKYITKEYEYKYKQKRGGKTKVLVGKNGKVYKDRIDDVLNDIKDPATKADARARIKQAIRDGERLTERSLASKIATDKYEKMLINAGYSIESFEEETGISFKDFSDKSNWTGDVFTLGAVSYAYKFNYEGNILTVV